MRNCDKATADQLAHDVGSSLNVPRRLRDLGGGTYVLELSPVREFKKVIMSITSGDIAEMDEEAKTMTLRY